MTDKAGPHVHEGGQEPDPEVQDRPEQNVGYDEEARGRLTREERERAERESPLTEDSGGPVS